MRPLVFMLVVLWLLASLGTFLPRFWMLALLVLCVPLGSALTEVSGRLTYLTRGLLMIGLLSNWSWGASFILDSEGWKVVWGRMDKAHYLNTSHRSYRAPYFDAAEFINRALPAEAGVLVLGDYRSFYLQRRFWAASAYDTPPMFALANASADGEDLYARLRARGITHILFNAAAVVPGSRYWKVTLTPQGRKAFRAFWADHTHVLFQEQSLHPGDVQAVFVYEVIDHHRPPELPEPDRLLNILDVLAGKL
jgi:hypothetical protein